MKTKLRSITIDNTVYKYSLLEKFVPNESPEIEGYYRTRLRIFRAGFKNTPLEIRFHTMYAYIIGNPLTHLGEEINLNTPGDVVKIFRLAIKQVDWDWNKATATVNGMELLAQLGIDIEDLIHEHVPPVKV